SYLIGERVLSGDALFVRGCGRTDVQNGDANALYDSLTNVLFALPDDTLVYPGHDYRGFTVLTIGEEKRFNPRVAGKSREEFVALMAGLYLPPLAKIDVAVPVHLRCGRAQQGA